MGVLWEYCLKNIHNYPRCIFTSLIILPKEVTQTQVLTMNRRFKTFTMSSFLKQVHMKMSLHAESLYNLFLNQFSRRQWKVNIKKLTSLVSFAMAQKTLLWLKSVFMFFLLIIKHSFQLFLSFHWAMFLLRMLKVCLVH